MKGTRWLHVCAAAGLAALAAGSTLRAADQIRGTVDRTYVIIADTDLTGDVVCNVAPGTPCFAFGAPNVELRLNGFTITGTADPATACGGVLVGGANGVSTNLQPGVAVTGPGLIQRFRTHGVAVLGSTGARVQGLTSSTNCGSGVFINNASFDTLVEHVVSVRNGSTSAGATCGGI